MIKTTRHSPDTCGCVILYDWDTEHPEDTRIHTNYRFEKQCAEHMAHQVHHVVAEHNLINDTKNHILSHSPMMQIKKTDEYGEVTTSLHRDVQLIHNWTDDRKLRIQFAGKMKIPDEHKSYLQSILDQNVGKDKVVVK
jgi:hypothetical protein